MNKLWLLTVFFFLWFLFHFVVDMSGILRWSASDNWILETSGSFSCNSLKLMLTIRVVDNVLHASVRLSFWKYVQVEWLCLHLRIWRFEAFSTTIFSSFLVLFVFTFHIDVELMYSFIRFPPWEKWLKCGRKTTTCLEYFIAGFFLRYDHYCYFREQLQESAIFFF